MMQYLHLGRNCVPGICLCGVRKQMWYRCVTFIDDEKNRCGMMTGPIEGVYAYHGQAHSHSWRPDDDDAMMAALDVDHGHKPPNYTVPAQFDNVSPNYPPQ